MLSDIAILILATIMWIVAVIAVCGSPILIAYLIYKLAFKFFERRT